MMMVPGRKSIGLFALTLALATAWSADAQQMPTYRGRVLDRATKKPVAGVVVEAQLQKEALPSGQRIVGRAKTDAKGAFTLPLTVNRSDVALIVSRKGSTSERIDFGGRAHNMITIEQPLAIELRPSTTKENVLHASSPGQKKQ